MYYIHCRRISVSGEKTKPKGNEVQGRSTCYATSLEGILPVGIQAGMWLLLGLSGAPGTSEQDPKIRNYLKVLLLLQINCQTLTSADFYVDKPWKLLARKREYFHW